MKLTRILLAATAIIALTTASAFAGGACCSGKKASSAQQAGASCGSASAATVASATCPAGAAHCGAGTCDWATCERMNIQYRVSTADQDLKTFDRQKALAFAKAEKAPVKYYYMATAYPNETAAKQALYASMNHMVDEMLTMQCVVNGEVIACEAMAAEKAAACKSAAAWRVASRDFNTKPAAEAYLRKLQAAVASVSLVDGDGKAVNGCAADYAKACGKKNVTFKVADQVASDPVTADVLRVREQLRVVMTTQA